MLDALFLEATHCQEERQQAYAALLNALKSAIAHLDHTIISPSGIGNTVDSVDFPQVVNPPLPDHAHVDFASLANSWKQDATAMSSCWKDSYAQIVKFGKLLDKVSVSAVACNETDF
jgi:hypothetical protein